MEANHATALDIVVSHPNIDKAEEWDPIVVMRNATARKHEVYCKWAVERADCVPISITTYGGVSDEALAYFQSVAARLAGDDADTQAGIMRRIRDIVAVNVVMGQGRVIAEWRRRNRDDVFRAQ